jgi:drug/metabolite transporter (DMT)-like permease
MEAKNKGLFAIHISVLLFGVSGIFGKLIDLHPIIIVLGRVFFASLFLGFILFYLKQTIKLKQKMDYLLLALLGIILAIHWGSFFQAIQVSTVAIGLITFSTFPVFTTFLEPIFFKEHIKFSNILLAIITFGGVALVIPDFELGSNITQGALWGIASGFSFSILSILNRKYVQNYSSFVIAFYQDFWAMIVLIPFLFFLQPVFQTHDFLLLLLLGIVFTAAAHTLFIKGLSSVKAQTASIITSLEPVYGIIIAIFLVNEIPSVRVLAGGFVILGVTFYTTVKSKEKPFISE